jgi:acetyl-CoA acetyltransferase
VTGRDVAIVGAGQSDYGDFPAMSAKDLFAEAYEEMRTSVDENYEPDEIDAAYVGNLGVGGSQLGLMGSLLVDDVGLDGTPVERVENACASGGFALLNAVDAVASGERDAAIAAGVEKMCDLSGNRSKYWLGVSGDTEYERLAGMTFAGVYAIMAQRYLAETDAEKEHLSKVAVKNHDNGVHNPHAQFRREVDLEDAVSAPTVADPLNLYDACPTSDGAACALVVPADDASRYTDDPVFVSGTGAGSDAVGLHDRDSITRIPAAERAAEQAYSSAGKTPDDVDIAEVHDCFTIAEILAYEDLGFAERGRGWELVEAGATAIDGDRPVNTSGGLKSKGHPLGATGIGQVVEVFEQLRGDAGERQVDASTALSHNVGGSGGAATVFIYEVNA